MIFAVLLLFSCVHVCFSDKEYVIPENFNIDDILKNKRLFKNYIDCLLDKGKCSPDGEKLKKEIPEALQNDCARCNDQIKEYIKVVIKHIIENQPDSWKLLEAKYDPNKVYYKKNEHFFKEAGVNV